MPGGLAPTRGGGRRPAAPNSPSRFAYRTPTDTYRRVIDNPDELRQVYTGEQTIGTMTVRPYGGMIPAVRRPPSCPRQTSCPWKAASTRGGRATCDGTFATVVNGHKPTRKLRHGARHR